MKSSLLVLALLGTAAHANTIDMGKWDCSGSPWKKMTVDPGAHDYVWHGSCGGAEGWSIEIKPRKHLVVKEIDGNGTLTLHVENHGTKTRTVKMHVFVGFA
jgi:hypothetical protein